MKTEKEDIGGGKIIELTYFSVPMYHEDWHRAEELGIVYAHYSHQGPDYWDDSMVFCKPEDKEAYGKYTEAHSW